MVQQLPALKNHHWLRWANWRTGKVEEVS